MSSFLMQYFVYCAELLPLLTLLFNALFLVIKGSMPGKIALSQLNSSKTIITRLLLSVSNTASHSFLTFSKNTQRINWHPKCLTEPCQDNIGYSYDR